MVALDDDGTADGGAAAELRVRRRAPARAARPSCAAPTAWPSASRSSPRAAGRGRADPLAAPAGRGVASSSRRRGSGPPRARFTVAKVCVDARPLGPLAVGERPVAAQGAMPSPPGTSAVNVRVRAPAGWRRSAAQRREDPDDQLPRRHVAVLRRSGQAHRVGTRRVVVDEARALVAGDVGRGRRRRSRRGRGRSGCRPAARRGHDALAQGARARVQERLVEDRREGHRQRPSTRPRRPTSGRPSPAPRAAAPAPSGSAAACSTARCRPGSRAR